MKRALGRILATVLGLMAALFSIEVGVRLVKPFPPSRTGHEVALFQGDQSRLKGLYQLDTELGYRPVFDTPLFDSSGFRRNDYDIDDRKGRQRVLFVGDSVTFRGKIIKALGGVYGHEQYEYWNAGVTGYNTAQEVAYFERYCLAAKPDQVVLTAHLNDYIRTPISFLDSEGRMQVISPGMHFGRMNPWLVRHSQLYRHVMKLLQRRENVSESEREIRTSLERFIELSEQHRFRLSIVLFPLMQAREQWKPIWKDRADWFARTLADLKTRHFFLEESVRRALADGVACQEVPGDAEHCSPAAAAYFAEDLKRAGLLDGGH